MENQQLINRNSSVIEQQAEQPQPRFSFSSSVLIEPKDKPKERVTIFYILATISIIIFIIFFLLFYTQLGQLFMSEKAESAYVYDVETRSTPSE